MNRINPLRVTCSGLGTLRWPLRARAGERELLDGPELDPAELRTNLRELAVLNRLPGGAGASIAAIARLVDRPELTILDVGTGGGDLPIAFARYGRRLGRWRVIASDSRPEVLALATTWTAGEPDVSTLLADGRRLPLDDGAVDVAHVSLLLHHFEPAEAVVLLSELRRVSRRGVVINDLRRGLLAFAAIAASVLLARGRYTRHDGILSARRAYTLAELDTMLGQAGLKRAWRSWAFLPRVVTVAVP